MADRENIPYTGEILPRSDTDDDYDETAYPTSTVQRHQPKTLSSNSESKDEYCHYWNTRNAREQSCWTPEFESGENEYYDSDISENVSISSENGNKNNELLDLIKYLDLIDNNVCDITKKDDKKNTISEEAVEKEDSEENDDTTEERNSLVRFLERSNLFIRNILRKAYDFSMRTPRE